MFSYARGVFALNRYSSLWGAVTLAIVLSSYTVSHAQSTNGVNTTGTFGNEVIQGKIYFPRGHESAMRPVVKLQSDSSSELTTVANPDGSFSFTRLRPDSYTIIVNGGDDYENAFETVTIGSAGTVPAQGNVFDYAIPGDLSSADLSTAEEGARVRFQGSCCPSESTQDSTRHFQ